MAKRANNEGTLYFREDRKRWCAQVCLDGRRLTKYARTQAECRDWLKETIKKIDHGLTYDGMQVTLEDFVATWLDGKDLSRAPRTVFQYRKMASDHILPALGKMRLQEIQPIHIRQLYTRKKAEGRGPRTLQYMHAVLHCALEQAVREGILGRNPADAVERPKVAQSEFKILTEEQCHQFLHAAVESPYEALFNLALTSGMRQGELLGLKWADLDWEKGTLMIQRQLQRVEHRGLSFVPPKTKAGRRTIKLGTGMLEKLASHKRQQEKIKADAGERWKENDLIFPSTLGTPLDSFRVSHQFKKLLKKNGLPDIRFHDLRHTSISFLLDMGIPVNTVQQRSGHSKASVTTDTYGHSMSHSQDEAAQRIDAMLLPAEPPLQSNSH